MSDTEAVQTTRRNSFVPIEFTEDISKQCLKQVEFYFSEFNFPYDRFLRTTAEKNDGWVPIGTIATFNRMKKFRPIEKVVEILRESKIIQVSEDGENVKRIVPLDLTKGKESRIEKENRTLVIMEVPFDHERLTIGQLQENLESFFHKINDNIVQIRLKRDNRKRFHGKVFVEFNSAESANEFLATYCDSEDDQSKEILSFEGKKLNVFSKKQYDLQREATRSKNFSGSGQRSRSFTGHRKNMPKLTPPTAEEQESAIVDEEDEESKPKEDKDSKPTEEKVEEEKKD